MNGRKADEDRIRAILDKQKTKLGFARRWWPKYLFRFDDIEAAASILNNGKLLSRSAAQARGLIVRDCASSDIIAATAQQYRQCVRLYFRPKTPMQYSNEGVRPATSIERGAHCPVPVVLLFDAMSVLGRATTRFSNGNLAVRGTEVGSDVDFFEKIPFDLVYHDGVTPPLETRKIVFHRHAEVIVPTELDLAPLKFVVCRSPAEQESLLYLLDARARDRWSKVTVTKSNMHNRKWNFVEQVDLVEHRLIFRFNRSYTSAGPFDAAVTIDGLESGNKYLWRDETYRLPDAATLRLKMPRTEARVRAEVRLDGALVYKNELSQSSEPI